MKPRPLFVGGAIAGVLLAGFWELAEEFSYSPAVRSFDVAVSGEVESVRAPMLTALMYGFTVVGGVVGISVLAGLLVAALLAARRRVDAAVVVALVAVGAALTVVLKGVFERVRPPAAQALIELPSSWSFPSGHTMGSLCLAAACCYVAIKSSWGRPLRVGVVVGSILFAAAVAVSRVYLGVHYPSDVLASLLLGGAVAASVFGVAASLDGR